MSDFDNSKKDEDIQVNEIAETGASNDNDDNNMLADLGDTDAEEHSSDTDASGMEGSEAKSETTVDDSVKVESKIIEEAPTPKVDDAPIDASKITIEEEEDDLDEDADFGDVEEEDASADADEGIDKDVDFHTIVGADKDEVKRLADGVKLMLKAIKDVNAIPNVEISKGRGLETSTLEEAIAASAKQAEDGLHSVNSYAIHSGWHGRMAPLSHADNDEVDIIGTLNWTSKSTWIRAYNFIYKHLSTENTGYSIPSVDYFKKLTSVKDFATMCFDLFRATFGDNSIPFSFKCQDKCCAEKGVIVEAALNSKTIKQFVKEEHKDILKKAEEIEAFAGQPVEWLRHTQKYTRTPLNFTENSNCVIEIQDLSLEANLLTLVTEKEEEILTSGETEAVEKITAELKVRAMGAYCRRIAYVINGKLHSVARKDFGLVLNALHYTDKVILEKHINDLANKNYVKYAITEVACPKCNTIYKNIEVDVIDLVFSREAVINRGWAGLMKKSKEKNI